MKIAIEYAIVFIIILIINYFLFIRNKKKYNKKNAPVELVYLLSLYRINLKKLDYSQFSWIYSIINSFIITTVYIIAMYLVDGLLWQVIVSIILLLLLTIICYGLLGRYYERKDR